MGKKGKGTPVDVGGPRWASPHDKVVGSHLEKVRDILSRIQERSTDRRGRLRYDFSNAERLFDLACDLFGRGKFGPLEVDGVRYHSLVDLLYRGVLGAANRLVAEGALGDAHRIIEELGDLPPGLIKEEMEVLYLLNEGKPREAAEKAQKVLRAALKARDRARREQRRAFVAGLGGTGGTIADYIGPEAAAAVRGAARGGREGKGGRQDSGRRSRQSKSPARKGRSNPSSKPPEKRFDLKANTGEELGSHLTAEQREELKRLRKECG